jgi:phenylpyruvate tautomerase PptA (4-oxalocrotonate tautomerase family)
VTQETQARLLAEAKAALAREIAAARAEMATAPLYMGGRS